MLQARDDTLVQQPFTAKYSDDAAWIDELQPQGTDRFPFDMPTTLGRRPN